MSFSPTNYVSTAYSYKKTFISDILKEINEVPSVAETSKVIMKAHIMGIITGIKKFHQRTIFTVDDGTGILNCILWLKEPSSLDKICELRQDIKFGNVALSHDMKTCALSLLEKGATSRLEIADRYDHGDMVSCLGNVRWYREELQLEILHHYEASNVDSETLWILDVLATKMDQLEEGMVRGEKMK